MSTESFLTLVAILVGPLIAVGITLWHDKRKRKRDAKLWVFHTLLANRRSSPPAAEWVSALNQIDVIFYDDPKVLDAWHAYYDELDHQPDQLNLQRMQHRHLDLLHEMAACLGYPRIRQTELDRVYIPVQFGRASSMDAAIQYEWYRVLAHTSSLLVVPRDDDEPTEGSPGGQATGAIEPQGSQKAIPDRSEPSKRRGKGRKQ